MIGYIILLNIVLFLIVLVNTIIGKKVLRSIKSSAERTASEVLDDFLIEKDVPVGVNYSSYISDIGGMYQSDKKMIHLSKIHKNSKNIFHIFIALHEAHHAYQFHYGKPISVRFFRIWKYFFYVFNTFLVLVSAYWVLSFIPDIILPLPSVNSFIEILFTIIYVLYVSGHFYTRYWIEIDSNQRTYRLMLENGYLESKKDRKLIKYFVSIFSKVHYFCYCFLFIYS